MKHRTILTALYMLAAFVLQLTYSAPVDGLTLEPSLLNLSERSTITIAYTVKESSSVSLTIMDMDHFPIRKLVSNRPSPAGSNSVLWDGKDDEGNLVPDGAYLPVITAVTKTTGQTTIIDPSQTSGGAGLFPLSAQVDKEAEKVTFLLEAPAKVRLRAGIYEGPICKVLLNWVALPAGEHSIDWDGKDVDGLRVVWDEPKFRMRIRAFELPQPCIILQGSDATYYDYWQAQAKAAETTMTSLRYSSEEGALATRALRTRNAARLEADVSTVDTYSLNSEFLNQELNFTLAITEGHGGVEDGQIIVDSDFRLTVNVDEATQEILSQQRFEMILYVDDLLFAEEETGFSPYSWVVPASRLSGGSHILSVNIATLSNQIGTASLPIVMRK